MRDACATGAPAGDCLRRPYFFLCDKKKYGKEKAPGEPSEWFPGALPPGQGGPNAPLGSPRICYLVPLFLSELPSFLPRPSSWRSVRFSRKRRSDRMLARDCGVYANRNPAAHEVRDDEGSLWCAFGDFPHIGKVTPPAGLRQRGELREGKKKRFPLDRQKKLPPEAYPPGCGEVPHPSSALRETAAATFPQGLRSRGAGVNDVPVARQSRA